MKNRLKRIICGILVFGPLFICGEWDNRDAWYGIARSLFSVRETRAESDIPTACPEPNSAEHASATRLVALEPEPPMP